MTMTPEEKSKAYEAAYREFVAIMDDYFGVGDKDLTLDVDMAEELSHDPETVYTNEIEVDHRV